MKLGILLISLFSSIAFAGPGTLNESGHYEGVHKPTRSSCNLTVSKVKTSFIRNWLKSAVISSSIMKNGETVSLSCSSHFEFGYSCIGNTQNKEVVILKPHHVDYGQGDVRGASLTIYSADYRRYVTCDDLELIQRL
jgi:hypothetical protein